MACPVFRPIPLSVSFDSCSICLGNQREADGLNQSTIIVGHIAGGPIDARVYHTFHETCLQNAIASNRRCPTCRLENVHIISTLSDNVFEAIMSNKGDILTEGSELDQRSLKEALWLAAKMEKDDALKALIQLPCFSKWKEEIPAESELEDMLSSNLLFLKAVLSSEVKFSDNQLKAIISKASQHESKEIIAALISSSAGQGDAIAELLVDLTKNLETQKAANASALRSLVSNMSLINGYVEIVKWQQDTIKCYKQQAQSIATNLKLHEAKLKKYLILNRIRVIVLIAGVLFLSVRVIQNHPHYFGLMEAKNYGSGAKNLFSMEKGLFFPFSPSAIRLLSQTAPL